MKHVHVIYQQFKGTMVRVDHPKGQVGNHNFVIQWKGMDWSGFRNLKECIAQFSELEARPGDHFTVVEK